jgi:hypothetical protein
VRDHVIRAVGPIARPERVRRPRAGERDEVDDDEVVEEEEPLEPDPDPDDY